MRNLKISANVSFLYQDVPNFLDRFAEAKRFGFQVVECASVYEFPVEDIQKAMEESDVDLVLVNMHPGSADEGVAAIPGQEEEFRESLAKTVVYAKALNCGEIHILAGVVKSPTLDHYEVFMKNLRYAVSILEKENIIGLIEGISSFSVPNYYLNTYPRAVNAVKEINSPYLRLQLDIFHVQYLHGNLTKNIESFLPYAGHIQIAQVPERNEPSAEGEMNYRCIFNLLRKLNYSGWVGLEYTALTSTVESLRWLEDGEYEGLEIYWD